MGSPFRAPFGFLGVRGNSGRRRFPAGTNNLPYNGVSVTERGRRPPCSSNAARIAGRRGTYAGNVLRGHRGRNGYRGNPRNQDNPSRGSWVSNRQSTKEDSGGDSHVKTRERNNSMGLRALRELAESEDPVLVFTVINEKSGFSLALEDEHLKDNPERMLYILKVLQKAIELHEFGATVGKAISLILHSKLLESLLQFNLSTLPRMCHLDPKDAQDMVRSEIVFFDLLVRLCPADEAMSVEAGFNAMKMPVFDLEKILGPDMELRLMMNRVRENLADLRKSVENPDHSVIRKKGFFGESHLDKAPDDFRTLSVLPTLNDLLGIEEPFLRANIISGRYLDADHYLDVQFRLIKEDFVRPLREGVAEMMRRMQNSLHDFGVWRKIQEVRIYEKGVITRKIYERVGVSLELKFSLRNLGQVRWEISKRLIFGSLLCLTNDNFKSVLFASVVEREVEDLRRGIIRIRPESSKFDLNAWTKGPEFLVVESAAFFEAYRHVLSSLQKIPLDQFPLKKYIVDVERNTSLPKYILDHEGDEANVFPLKFKGRQFFGNPFSTDDWPKPEELGLDEAQFCAFKAGLCHEFALIQGPPGTGKTFIGLKLVKTILSRRRKHKIFNNGPILVVCFTNHALDQFLEGISRFTRRILRIGGRSKSVLLEEFTVQNAPLLRSKGNACQVRSDMKNHLIILERSLGELETLKKGISAGAGILSLEKLREYNIEIPSCFPSSFSLANWLSFPSNSNNLSQNFLKQILDEEKKLIFAEKKNLRFPTEDAEDDADDGGIDRVAVVDLDIEDEAAAEAQRREVESIYDTDCEAKMPTAARAKEIILHHCEISYMSIENDLNRAEKDVQDTAEQLDASNGAAECLDVLQQGGFWEEHMRKTQHLMQAELRLENWKLMRSKFQADSAFLKVPANLDLVKPPKQLVGPEENWVNARLRARWLIYRYWANRFVRIIHGKIDARMEEYRLQVERYKEAQDGALLQYTQSLDVVGMTTTGAARNISLVQNMKSRILVVEEAAEVLESHIVCCLSSHCEHLIQIGDQQQLRPSTNVYKLAKNYGLDVSLFERMVKNRVPYARLRQQHRMRPEISNLIKLNVYEDLQDHESVTQYADVLGVAKNVFFVTHNFPEESNEDLKSKSNKVEAEFLLALCRYLLLQGYKREQITILTGYSGQLFVFKKLIANFPTCKDVRITLVDNYQGEENDIILLSLVRSNTEGNIGFLKTDNRVNVALSRAKQGLFIIGNMDVLSAGSKLWSNIKLVLVKENQIGRALPLRCQNHVDQVISVFKPSEFPVAGGCTKMCNGIIDPCGHLCKRWCHVIDKDHRTKYNSCRHPCERKCPALESHSCKSLCGVSPCPPCPEKVERMLVPCDHMREMECCEKVDEVNCLEKCFARLHCGHACGNRCHVRSDPGHELAKCSKPCGKSCPRNHPCKAKCFANPCPPCKEPVNFTLVCGHTVKSLCHVEPEKVKCKAKVEKRIPDCSHSVTLECMEVPEKSHCKKKCRKILTCGHVCAEKCASSCTTSCSVMVEVGKIARCGHQVRLPCQIIRSGKILSADEEMEYCDHPCGAILSCGHTCSGKCSSCFQGRIHVPCEKACERQLVCGHVCKAACSFNCPPCEEKCGYSCPHASCTKLCGEPCSPCMEKCKSGCRHKPCKLRCSDDCGRGADKCNQACEKVLSCQHKCVGLCGEICPPCRECGGDTVEFFDVTKNDVSNEPDARFILLQKCKHVIEVGGLDHWMRRPMEAIGPRVCPRCKTPIVSSHRYKDEVNSAFRKVTAVRNKIFGQNDDLRRLLEKLTDQTGDSPGKMIQEAFSKDNFIKKFFDEIWSQNSEVPEREEASESSRFGSRLRKNADWPKGIRREHLSKKGKKQLTWNFKQLNGMESNCISNRIHLLGALAAVILDLEEASLFSGDGFMNLKLRELARLVMSRKHNLNGSGLEAFSAEIRRFRFLKLLKILRDEDIGPEKQLLISQVENKLFNSGSFTEGKEKELIKLLEEAEWFVEAKDERVNLYATAFQYGLWYTCPEKHVFCVGDYGSVVLRTHCPECNDGTNHG